MIDFPTLTNDARQHGYDDVCGTVVGGDYVPWRVVYDDRPQSQKQYAENDDAAVAAGKALIAELKAQYCGEPHHLYAEPQLWAIRIYED